MASPRFSIVIPTRERARTLSSAIKTCLEQDFSDYEIIVCDNFSSPATKQVVDALSSDKIRYVRSPAFLSMSANWELAVSHAQGEYVIVLGDDDGLMFHALRELDRLIQQTCAKVIRWTAAHYTWPDFALPGQGNYLRVPCSRSYRSVKATEAIAKVIAFRSCYTSLPMLYNSAVHRDIIAEIKKRTGCVFANCYPDVYTGFAVAWVAEQYLSLQAPMTIAGSSGKSYGIANLFRRGKSPLDLEFRESNVRDGLRAHPWVPDLALFPYGPVADSFLIAKELLFPEDQTLQLNRRDITASYVATICADDEPSWRAALEIIRHTLRDDGQLLSWFDANLRRAPYRPPTDKRIRSERLGLEGEDLHLSSDQFGVEDVFGAAQLCERILNFRNYGLTLYLADDCTKLTNPLGSTGSPEEMTRLREVAAQRLDIARNQGQEIRELERLAERRLAEIDLLETEVRRLRYRTFSGRVYHLCKRMARLVPSGIRRLIRGAGTGQGTNGAARGS